MRKEQYYVRKSPDKLPQKTFGHVFQMYNLIANLNVKENIEVVNQKYGNTVIMVTHNEAIRLMADHVIKLRDQLDHSMGDYMNYYQILCILLSAVLIYLLI